MTKKQTTTTEPQADLRPCSTIHAALCACMADVEAVGKNRKNKEQGYAYRGIDDLYNSLHPIFARHRVFVTCDVLLLERSERVSNSGKTLNIIHGRYRVTFHAEDGSHVSVECAGEAMDSGDKATNKASSAALKYALMQTLLIPTEEAKDSEVDTYELPARQQTPPAPRRLPAATDAEVDRCRAAIYQQRSAVPYQQLIAARELSEDQNYRLIELLQELADAEAEATAAAAPDPAEVDDRPTLPKSKPAGKQARVAF